MSTILPLIALALVDSTSFGTLIIPLALVIRRRGVDIPSLLVYFGTVVGFYFLIGIGLLLGLDIVGTWASDLLESRPVQWAQLALGLGLLAFAVLKDSPKDQESRTARLPGHVSARAMIGLGVGATLLEIATMVPYIAAMGIVSSMEIPFAGKLALLLGYCVVMILPAVVLIALARVVGEKIWPRLEKGVAWIERQTAETMLWVAGIVGFFLALNAAGSLGLIG